MKGLFLDNFYKTISSMKIFAFIVLLAGITVLVTGNATALELFVYIAITALSVNGVSSLRKDRDAKWNKLELTLPVKRRVIIDCKYVSYLFWVLVGTVTAMAFTGLALLIHGNVFFAFGLQDITSLFTLGIGIALLVGALFYPLAYFLGADKSETMLVMSVIGGILLAVFLVWFINRGEAPGYYLRLGYFALIVSVLFGASYVTTVNIYCHKEF